jgi:NitT/TauT family transport system permease protein
MVLWEAAVKLFHGSYAAVPPSQVLTEFVGGMAGAYWPPLLASLRRILLGYGMALVIGVTLGSMIASNRFCEWLFGMLVMGVQSLPSICWLPVAILWFGLNERAILFVVLMGSVGSITIATRDGLRGVPPIFHRVGDTFGASAWQKLLFVSLPAALPSVVSGMKQGWSFAWRSLMAGELLYHSRSLGSLLSDSRDLADYPRMYSVMLLVVLASVLVDRTVFTRLERSVRARWGLQTAQR